MIKRQKHLKSVQTYFPVKILSIYNTIYYVHIRISYHHYIIYAINRLPWVKWQIDVMHTNSLP